MKKLKGGTAAAKAAHAHEPEAHGDSDKEGDGGYKELIETLPEDARPGPNEFKGKHNYTKAKVGCTGRIHIQSAARSYVGTRWHAFFLRQGPLRTAVIVLVLVPRMNSGSARNPTTSSLARRPWSRRTARVWTRRAGRF